MAVTLFLGFSDYRIIDAQETVRLDVERCQYFRESDDLEAFGTTTCEITTECTGGGRTTVSCAAKSNVLPKTDGLFARCIERAVCDYESLTYEHIHADDGA